MEWKPIDSAPKDGTKVDLWILHEFSGSSFRVPDCYWINNRWVQTGIPLNRGERPTHWSLPLPPPPKEES